MRYFVFILSSIFINKAHALNAHTQCSLDERPLLLEYSFSNESSKELFEVKKLKKVINHNHEDAVFISDGKSVAFIDRKGAPFRAFKVDRKTYYLGYEKKTADKEICYPAYKEIEEGAKGSPGSYKDLKVSCHYAESMDSYFAPLNHESFYKKSEVKKLKKRILKTKSKNITLDKAYTFLYYADSKVEEAKVVAKAKINNNQFKSYRCAEGSKIIECGKNCLKYTKENLFDYQQRSERFRVNLRDTKAQYLIEFELSYHLDEALEDYDEEETNKRLTESLKDFDGPLDLKELRVISKTISKQKPYSVISIRAVKYQ